MRRLRFFAPIFVLSLIWSAPGALAQDATPEATSPFADLGLPELSITATNEGMQIDTAETPAGRYLVHFTNASDSPEASAGFVRLVEGKTLADLSMADELAAGTPIPMEGPPAEEAAWLYDTYLTGGGSNFSPEVVVDLPAGEYGVWADDPASPLTAAPLTVTGDPDAAIEGPEPTASVTITEEGVGGKGFGFNVEGDLVAGSQVVKVHNDTDQPHFIIALTVPEGTTEDQVRSALMFDPTSGATPTADMADLSQAMPVAWVGAQSGGTTQWGTMNLEAGQVAILCFVTDPKAGDVPHAMEGMMRVLPVG